jgi:hypothetical protein
MRPANTGESRAHGDHLFEINLHLAGQMHFVEAHPGGPFDEIGGNGHIRAELDCGSASGSEGDVEAIGERDGLEDRTQLMVPVGPLAEHSQIEIDLRQGADAGTPDRRHHLSYCSKENTS